MWLDYRLFRLDRLQAMRVTEDSFTRAADFDLHAFVREHLSRRADTWQIAVEFHAPLRIVQQKIAADYGMLSETPTGVLFQTQYGDLADVARFLVIRNLPFVVHEPPELRAELLKMAEQITHSATAAR